MLCVSHLCVTVVSLCRVVMLCVYIVCYCCVSCYPVLYKLDFLNDFIGNRLYILLQ